MKSYYNESLTVDEFAAMLAEAQAEGLGDRRVCFDLEDLDPGSNYGVVVKASYRTDPRDVNIDLRDY